MQESYTVTSVLEMLLLIPQAKAGLSTGICQSQSHCGLKLLDVRRELCVLIFTLTLRTTEIHPYISGYMAIHVCCFDCPDGYAA